MVICPPVIPSPTFSTSTVRRAIITSVLPVTTIIRERVRRQQLPNVMTVTTNPMPEAGKIDIQFQLIKEMIGRSSATLVTGRIRATPVTEGELADRNQY